MLKRVSFLLGLGLAAGLLAACQVEPATAPPATLAPAQASVTAPPPTATPIVPATATAPAATATPAPSATVTETPTPAASPTPDPNLGVGATLWEDQFDGARWGWNFADDVVNFSLGDGQLNAVMSRSDSFWRVSSGPDFVTAGDQQIRLTARTNLCYDQDEYGLIFRNTSTPDFKFNGYLFKVNCAGQARVEILRDSVPGVLLDWTAAPSLQPGAPAENTLLVWAGQDKLNFYLNDKYVGSVTDRAFAAGSFGLYVRDRTNGGLSVSFRDLVLKEVVVP